MEIRDGSRVSRDDASLTDRDEQALEAIRRQLDAEFPHSVEITTPQPPPTRPRRRPAAMVLGVLLACAGGAVAAVLVTMLSQAIQTRLTLVRESAASAPAVKSDVLTVARPATPQPAQPAAMTTPSAPPPPPAVRSARPATREPASRVAAPDVGRVHSGPVETRPTSVPAEALPPSLPTETLPAPVRAETLPAPVPADAPVALATPVEHVAVERPIAAAPRASFSQAASGQMRAAWNIVRQRLAGPTGEMRADGLTRAASDAP